MAEIEIIPESIKLIKISDEEYFSEKYKDYISNSKLKLINPEEGGSEELYESGLKSKYSDSFELGSAVHAMLLQPDYFEIAPVKKPTSKLGLFADKAYEFMKAGKSKEDAINEASLSADYYANKLTEKRLITALEACEPYWKEREEFESKLKSEKTQIYLSSPMEYKYQRCVSGLINNTKLMKTLNPDYLLDPPETYNEYAIFAEIYVINGDRKTKLKVKAKLDNFIIDHETQTITLNDVKTTGKPIGFFMGNYVQSDDPTITEKIWYDGSFQKFHYYRQMAFYLWLLACYCKTQGINYKTKANMVVVETVPEFSSKVYIVNGKHIKQGLDEFKKLLILVSEWIEKQ